MDVNMQSIHERTTAIADLLSAAHRLSQGVLLLQSIDIIGVDPDEDADVLRKQALDELYRLNLAYSDAYIKAFPKLGMG